MAPITRPAPSRLRNVLQRHAVLDAHIDALTAWLSKSGPLRPYKVAEPVGDSKTSLAGVIASGWIGRIAPVRGNEFQIIDVLLPGDSFGFAAHCQQSSLIALTAVQIAVADLAEIPRGEPEEAFHAFTRQNQRAERQRQLATILRLGALTPSERTCALLLELRARLADRGSETAGFSLPLSQGTLANILGISAIHMNRTLRSLRLEGAVEMSNGLVAINDLVVTERFSPDLLAAAVSA